MRIRLDLSYDGTDFSGWAVQPGRRTVAGTLGDALAVLFRQPVRLVVAGRTDAGVHAEGQVAHVDVLLHGLLALAPRGQADRAPIGTTGPDPRSGPNLPLSGHFVPDGGLEAGCRGLLRRLSGLLPPDVRVRAATPAPDGFDARFSALRRHYAYRISTDPWGADPLLRRTVLAHRRDLDVSAMADAASRLTGLRDFAAYCRPREGATTIRDLQALTVRRERTFRDADGAGAADGLVVIEVTADAFCHSMVRSLVGALLAVGDGSTPADRPAALLDAAARTAAIRVAPAHALTLVAVDYPSDAELLSRASQTRAVRGPHQGSNPRATATHHP